MVSALVTGWITGSELPSVTLRKTLTLLRTAHQPGPCLPLRLSRPGQVLLLRVRWNWTYAHRQFLGEQSHEHESNRQFTDNARERESGCYVARRTSG